MTDHKQNVILGRSVAGFRSPTIRPGNRIRPEPRPARAASGPSRELPDIADVMAFLASDVGRWVTGHSIDATGGSLAQVKSAEPMESALRQCYKGAHDG